MIHGLPPSAPGTEGHISEVVAPAVVYAGAGKATLRNKRWICLRKPKPLDTSLHFRSH